MVGFFFFLKKVFTKEAVLVHDYQNSLESI